MELQDLRNYTIFEGISGSRAYGNSTPESDYDYRSLVLPPLDVLLDPSKKFGQKTSWEDGEDRVAMNVIKFAELAVKANPNIIELLFLPEECITYTTDAYSTLTKHKYGLLTKQCEHTYKGYAMQQLSRMNKHKAWFDGGVVLKPEPAEFGLEGMMEKGAFIALGELYDDFNGSVAGVKALTKMINARREFDAKQRNYEEYNQWKANRNEARAELERKHGYDCKAASHLIRLLEQSAHIAIKGTLNVRLKGRTLELVQSVRAGEVTYDQLMVLSSSLQQQCSQAYVKAELPKRASEQTKAAITTDLIKAATFNPSLYLQGSGELSY
jgi:predicted nucleotidyltransferase